MYSSNSVNNSIKISRNTILSCFWEYIKKNIKNNGIILILSNVINANAEEYIEIPIDITSAECHASYDIYDNAVSLEQCNIVDVKYDNNFPI